jgi:hypothetical protein
MHQRVLYLILMDYFHQDNNNRISIIGRCLIYLKKNNSFQMNMMIDLHLIHSFENEGKSKEM